MTVSDKIPRDILRPTANSEGNGFGSFLDKATQIAEAMTNIDAFLGRRAGMNVIEQVNERKEMGSVLDVLASLEPTSEDLEPSKALAESLIIDLLNEEELHLASKLASILFKSTDADPENFKGTVSYLVAHFVTTEKCMADVPEALMTFGFTSKDIVRYFGSFTISPVLTEVKALFDEGWYDTAAGLLEAFKLGDANVERHLGIKKEADQLASQLNDYIFADSKPIIRELEKVDALWRKGYDDDAMEQLSAIRQAYASVGRFFGSTSEAELLKPMVRQLIHIQHASRGERINDAIKAVLALKLIPPSSTLRLFKHDVEGELVPILEGAEMSRTAGSEAEAAEADTRAAELVSYFKIAQDKVSAIEQKINNERLLRQEGNQAIMIIDRMLNVMYADEACGDIASSLFETYGRELLEHYLARPVALAVVVSPEGYTLADMFAKYAQPDVVKRLLTVAINYDLAWNILSRTHTLGSERVSTSTLALAKASLEGRDDGFLSRFASEAIKVLTTYVMAHAIDQDSIKVAMDFGLKDEVELAMLEEVQSNQVMSLVLGAARYFGSPSETVKQGALLVFINLLYSGHYSAAKEIADAFELSDQKVKPNVVELLQSLVQNGSQTNFCDAIMYLKLESRDLGAAFTQVAIKQIVELVDEGAFQFVAKHFHTLGLFRNDFSESIVLCVMNKVRESVNAGDLSLAAGLIETFHLKRNDFTDIIPAVIIKVKESVFRGDLASVADAVYYFQLEREELGLVMPRVINKVVALRTEGNFDEASRIALDFGINSDELTEEVFKPIMDFVFNQYLASSANSSRDESQ